MAADNYDFVIIGGGTAGLVLANRLTEDSTIQVLVLEAGEDLTSDPRTKTPLLYPALMGSDADWNSVSEPQSALNNRTINLPHGRALGGGSAINGQAFIATSKVGIDMWGELGNSGWNWDALAPYFKKSFALDCPPTDNPVYDHFRLNYIDADVNGTDGPIKVSFPTDTDDPFPKAWVDAMSSLGHKASGDPFSGNFTGAFTNAASIDPLTRQRCGAAEAYWKPVQSRKNLTILTGAHVEKITLAGSAPDVVATGALYVHKGETKTASAREEVILSAGTLHSPKLLELSGIGDPELLSSLGIPVLIANKYVGENLQDHPMTGLSFEVKDGLKTMDDLLRHDAAAVEEAMKQYTESQSGPLAVGGLFSYALLPLQDTLPPDVIQKYCSSSSDTHPLAQPQTEYLTRLLQNPHEATATFCAQATQGNFGADTGSALLQADPLPGGYYSVAVYILQPLSRGRVHIRAADPGAPVRVDPRYLTHPLDVELLARHLTYVTAVVGAEPLASLLKPGGRRNPAAPADLADVGAMREYARRSVLSSWHPTSTCAMLPSVEQGGVVGDRLVVHGARNLRVVDASVFPITTRANPMATVYAVAERAADLIKEDLAASREGVKVD
ncbi:glucose-methanol-choline oxidoreductase-like protein [Whalleya microplaca]|nr:glucose-methanol-choline oxidoreductase-like protein [Whalleya microplaca]